MWEHHNMQADGEMEQEKGVFSAFVLKQNKH